VHRATKTYEFDPSNRRPRIDHWIDCTVRRVYNKPGKKERLSHCVVSNDTDLQCFWIRCNVDHGWVTTDRGIGETFTIGKGPESRGLRKQNQISVQLKNIYTSDRDWCQVGNVVVLEGSNSAVGGCDTGASDGRVGAGLRKVKGHGVHGRRTYADRGPNLSIQLST
jgi:hypothetical protein